MSLLMKALKQAERDHDEAIKTAIDPDTDSASAEPGDSHRTHNNSADESFELSLSNQSGLEPELSHVDDSIEQPQQDVDAVIGVASSEPEFEKFEAGQIDGVIDQHYGEQPDLSRHRVQSDEPSVADAPSLDYSQEAHQTSPEVDDTVVEPGMIDGPDGSDGFDEVGELGLEIDLDESDDSEQTLIDTANEGAFLGTAKLATVKKRPTVFRKLIAVLSLAVLAIVGAGWYALELLHIPSPVAEPVLGPTNVRTVQSTSSSLSPSLAKTDFQSTASVGAVSEQPSQQNTASESLAAGNTQDKEAQASGSGADSASVTNATQTSVNSGNASSTGTVKSSAPAPKKQKPVLKLSAAKPSVPATLNPGPRPEIEFRKVPNAQEQQSELLNNAYAALRANDDDKAGQLYQQALANDQLSTDVWVGLATLAVRRGDVTRARQAYENALRINPNDSVAIAGKMSLQGEGDALSQESRYRTLLAANPNDAALQFALASTLAAQDRWVDAQKAYFNAASAAPSHPDYAFNLAVSLEHIRQPNIALQYYARALELAVNHRPEFDLSMAEQRIKALRSNSGRK